MNLNIKKSKNHKFHSLIKLYILVTLYGCSGIVFARGGGGGSGGGGGGGGGFGRSYPSS